ncbi:zona pellucida sperm-binding protein 4-like isoform X2 [Protopterus annectens]|uniref:zona pellucida sperm-binding protein 4-like isoform X2 n=1 Tax=Protopterus annectens TaxID=7888 RepID=UPI001CFBD278|nr:zona pellucida sperm-binding protein 4-like isoform X2 [Protopterus annectens]
MMALFNERGFGLYFVILVGLIAGDMSQFYEFSYDCFQYHVEVNFQGVHGWNISVLDYSDMATPLSRVSPNCGLISYGNRNEGWLIVLSTYTGCYVQENFPQGITLLFELRSLQNPEKRKATVECNDWPPQRGEMADSASRHWRRINLKQSADQYEDKMCSIPPSRRVSCGSADITENACLESGCCYAPQDTQTPCYYGITGCTSNGFFTIVLQKELTKPDLDLNSVSLANPVGSQCSPVFSSTDIMVYKFPVSECGAVRKTEGNNVMYEVNILATKELLVGRAGTITRDGDFGMTVTCTYNGSQALALQVTVHTMAPPLPATDEGSMRLELRIAKDVGYNTWYVAKDYPVLKFLRDPIYVEVQILGRTDPSIVLVLEECWATPSADPNDNIFWNLLVASCPYTGDNYITVMHPVDAGSGLQFPTHHKRFELKTFVFLDSTAVPLSGNVFIHCSATVCHPSSRDTCTTTCPPRYRRSVNHLSIVDNEEAVVSSGLLILRQPELNRSADRYDKGMYSDLILQKKEAESTTVHAPPAQEEMGPAISSIQETSSLGVPATYIWISAAFVFTACLCVLAVVSVHKWIKKNAVKCQNCS